MNAAKSLNPRRRAKPAPETSAPSVLRETVVAAILILLATVMIRTGGSRRGVNLMPWPDGLEYAAAAINLDHGRGPVLHFGGYSYPSRYTAGYPLILAALAPGLNGPERLYVVNVAIGMLEVGLLFALALTLFGPAAAIVAALLLALSPVFLTYSDLVLSDVPAMLMVTIPALLLTQVDQAEARGSTRRMVILWALVGLTSGFAVIIRPTNVVILLGFALCLVMVPPARIATVDNLKSACGFGVGFAIPILFQLRENAVYLGGPFRSGYSWWVSEVYGSMGGTFSPAYLFGPTLPRDPIGNVPIYLTSLLGVDGMLGSPGDTRYLLYPVAGAIFAIIGLVAGMRAADSRTARRVIWFGIGFLVPLILLYCFYLFTDVVFILPGCFVLFIAAGYGTVRANIFLREVYTRARARTGRRIAGAIAVVILDLILVIALATEAAVRLSITPPKSEMVPALMQANAKIPPHATVVSNISLQFLQLYIPGSDRTFIGFNSLDPGEQFTDYHLHRLFDKIGLGWTGRIPPTLFIGGTLSQNVEKSIADAARSPEDGAVLLLCAPESRDYSNTIRDEVADLSIAFMLQPMIENAQVAVYRLIPR